jgi:hypothetical protein
MRFFTVYQYVAPIAFLTLGYSLWLRRFSGDHRMVLLVLSVPVVFGYVIPALGANALKLWEIKTRFRIGRIRPHHGFVFGSAAGLIALLCVDTSRGELTPFALFRSAFVVGSVIAFWNWLYDGNAIRAGYIIVYNRLWAENAGPDSIAADHAPVLFGTFGACYGAAIMVDVHVLVGRGLWGQYWTLLAATNAAALVLPVLAYVAMSYLRRGESGLRSYADTPGLEPAKEGAGPRWQDSSRDRSEAQPSSMLQ